MKKAIVCSLLILLYGSTTYPDTGFITVGIAPFSGKKEEMEKSKVLVSEISAGLGKYRFVKLVERSKLDEIAREIEFGMTGMVDERTVVKAGKIHGLQVMVVGTMSDRGISARAIHIETSKVIASHSVPSLSGADALAAALAKAIEVFLARETLKGMRNDSPDIDLDFRIGGTKGLSRGLEITESAKNPKLKIGETVAFRFRSNKDGYLTIVDIQPGGDVVVLFPNDMSPSNRIEAGRWYSIPSENDSFEIHVSEPAGKDTVVAFFTEAKVDWLDRGKLEGSGFQQVKDGEKLAMTRGLKVVSTGLKSSQWESRVIEIDVNK